MGLPTINGAIAPTNCTRLPESSFIAAAALAACVIPAHITHSAPPVTTAFNQFAALLLWGLFVFVCADPLRLRCALRDGWQLLAALALLGAAAAASSLFGALPASLGLAGAASCAAAVAMGLGGLAAGRAARRQRLAMVAFGLVAAGVLASLAGAVQVFAPQWGGNEWIARSSLVGRAVGNLRQPNHLSSLLLWSAVAVVPLADAIAWRRASAGTLPTRLPAWGLRVAFALHVFGITLSGSRTGIVGIGVLALWGLVDRRLRPSTRALLLAAPLLYGAAFAAMLWWAEGDQAHTFGAALHMAAGGDVSSSRFAIWRDTLTLIAAQPWRGVGFGEFNFAWTLSVLPQRPVALFDHTHNLPLQLLVELGLPLGGLLIALLASALWLAWRRSATAQGADGVAARTAFVMVLLMALHSQLEYPLWYLYFLLPTAWAWGLCLAAPQAAAAQVDSAATPPPAPSALATRLPATRLLGALLVAGGLFATYDYHRVTPIYAPGFDAPSLDERIAAGQRSWLFGHQGDYAAATTAQQPADAWPAFAGATHNLLDTRLMIAWAKALAERGDLAGAQHLAARLREFRNPLAAPFFEPCKHELLTPPFQCEPPARPLGWRDFIGR